MHPSIRSVNVRTVLRLSSKLLLVLIKYCSTKQTNKCSAFFFSLISPPLCLQGALPRARQRPQPSPLGTLVSLIRVGQLVSRNHLVNSFPLVVPAACEGPYPFSQISLSDSLVRVRCDLKDLPIGSVGPLPACSNCKERGIKCVLVSLPFSLLTPRLKLIPTWISAMNLLMSRLSNY